MTVTKEGCDEGGDYSNTEEAEKKKKKARHARRMLVTLLKGKGSEGTSERIPQSSSSSNTVGETVCSSSKRDNKCGHETTASETD